VASVDEVAGHGVAHDAQAEETEIRHDVAHCTGKPWWLGGLTVN
jgi:hypothetical protein